MSARMTWTRKSLHHRPGLHGHEGESVKIGTPWLLAPPSRPPWCPTVVTTRSRSSRCAVASTTRSIRVTVRTTPSFARSDHRLRRNRHGTQKAGGSSRNGRDSEQNVRMSGAGGQRLSSLATSSFASAAPEYHLAKRRYRRDHTVFALVEGTVQFTVKGAQKRRHQNIVAACRISAARDHKALSNDRLFSFRA